MPADRIAALLLAAAFAVLCASIADALRIAPLRIAPLPGAPAGRDVEGLAAAVGVATGPRIAADANAGDAGAGTAHGADAHAGDADGADADGTDADGAAAGAPDPHVADADAAATDVAGGRATRSDAARRDPAVGSGAPSVRAVERVTRAVLAAVARDPFRPDRRQRFPRQPVAIRRTAAGRAARRVTLPPLWLAGTASFADGGGFAALGVQGRAPLLVPVGDTLAGLRLVRVDTGSAVLEGADTVLLLELARRPMRGRRR
jgi:hypothetical protein